MKRKFLRVKGSWLRLPEKLLAGVGLEPKFLCLFFFEVQLVYTVLLTSGVQPSDLVILCVFVYIHVSIFFFRFFFIIGCSKILNAVLCAIQQILVKSLAVLCIVVSICQSQTPNLSLPIYPLVTINLFPMSVSLFLF